MAVSLPVVDLTPSMVVLPPPVKPIIVSRKSDSLPIQKGKNLYFTVV